MENKSNFFTFLGLPLIGALVGSLVIVLVQQYYFETNKKTEQKAILKKNILESQYELINELKLWNTINIQTQIVVFANDTLVHRYPVAMTVTQAKPGHTEGHEIPALFYEPYLQNTWKEINVSIEKNKYKINVDLYTSYSNIVQQIDTNSFSERILYSTLYKQGWDSTKVQNWIKENLDFAKKIDEYEDGKIE